MFTLCSTTVLKHYIQNADLGYHILEYIQNINSKRMILIKKMLMEKLRNDW